MGEVAVFYRPRWFTYGFVLFGILWGLSGIIRLVLDGDFIGFGVFLAFGIYFVVIGLIYRRPFIRVSNDRLEIKLAPARPTRRIPWSSILSVSRPRPKVVVLALKEGKQVKLYLSNLRKGEKESFLTLLDQYTSSAGAA